MNRKIGLKDIAAKVGVSTALVSYVLNNKKEGRINKSVAAKIREVATDLNYRTNQIAKSLKTNKTFTIGLIIGNIANPFFSGLARIIEDEAEVHNYTVLFGSSDENPLRTQKLVDTFIDRQVDGIILAPGENNADLVLSLQRQRIPFVLVDRYLPNINTSYVALDNFQASGMAIHHLVQCGYQRIGMITFKTPMHHLEQRRQGYMDALAKEGILFNKDWLVNISTNHEKKNVEQALDRLLSLPEPVDAILFATNAIATHGLKHINYLQVKVPDQLALISFDKTDALDLFYAPLTVIEQPLAEMGQLATKTLINLIEGSTTVAQYNLPAHLMVRASTCQQQPAGIL